MQRESLDRLGGRQQIGCCCACEQKVARVVADHDVVGLWGTPPFLHVAFSHKLTEQLSG